MPDRFPSETAFAEPAAEQNVLVIPGNIFSGRDSHCRMGYATSEDMIRRGCEVLCRLGRSANWSLPLAARERIEEMIRSLDQESQMDSFNTSVLDREGILGPARDPGQDC